MFENLREDFGTHGRSLRSGGFWTLAVYRFGRWSMTRRSAAVRALSSCVYGGLRAAAQLATGIVLERETQIGRGFHIIHCGMISIHPRAIIGDRVGIMHGVTLGTNMSAGAPVIGDDVFIGCHASVLGEISVGRGARISANSLVISDVPDGAVAVGVPARATTLSFTTARPATRVLARTNRSA